MIYSGPQRWTVGPQARHGPQDPCGPPTPSPRTITTPSEEGKFRSQHLLQLLVGGSFADFITKEGEHQIEDQSSSFQENS